MGEGSGVRVPLPFDIRQSFPKRGLEVGILLGRGPYLVWARVEADAGALNLTAERLERAVTN